MLQTRAVPSLLDVAMRVPLGEKVQPRSHPEWPSAAPDREACKTQSSSPVATFQSLEVLSPLAVASSAPSGEKAHPVTPARCPRRATQSSPSAAFHKIARLSSPAVASSSPSGENAHVQTAPVWPRSSLSAISSGNSGAQVIGLAQGKSAAQNWTHSHQLLISSVTAITACASYHPAKSIPLLLPLHRMPLRNARHTSHTPGLLWELDLGAVRALSLLVHPKPLIERECTRRHHVRDAAANSAADIHLQRVARHQA